VDKAQKKVVVLHIGAMKTGTTYVQGKAYANRDALRAAGVDLAGRRWADQVWAVQELLGMGKDDPQIVRRNAGAWDRLAAHVLAAPEPVSLLTMEFLAFADRAQARRVVDSLEDCEVRVVVTVRDTAAVVPALWQTTVTSGGTTPWPRFRSVFRWSTRAGGRGARALTLLGAASAVRFEEAIDIARMLRVWTSVLPAHQVHVVVVPGPGAPRDRLWELLSEVVGVDPAVAAEEGDNPNESLGYPSAEVVRRVNEVITIEHLRYQAVVKNDLGHHTLGRRRKIERRARLDRPTLRAALHWNATIRRAIRRSGVTVHGDLADLPTAPQPAHAVEERHEEPTQAELLEAAEAGLARMRRLVNRRTKRLMDAEDAARLKTRLREAIGGPDAWPSAPDPVAAAVADLVVYAEGLVELRKVRDIRRREEQRAARRKARQHPAGPSAAG
jgi:hypothetical protein